MSPSESDRDLLQSYAATGSQEAFAALVRRHLDLVYSAARRQVRSPELAEEIAQAVFLDLSRAAGSVPADAPLAAWLYVVTRRTAVDAIRRESRRQAREHAAYEIAAMNSPNPEWPLVEPLLDEAMESLDADARSAVLLRYFENKSLREVGQALGTSDDTAQKRVSRAVDQLRTFLLRRGVAVSAAGLTTNLSAHAIQSAPTALGASISTATAAVAGHALLAEGTKTFVMTSLQKTSLAAVLALTVGAGLYEGGLLYRRSGELQSQRAQVAALDAQVAGTQRRRTGVDRQTAALREQIASLQAALAQNKVAVDPAMEAEMRAWYDRLDRINRAFAEHPEQKIPELQFLADKDWFAAAQKTELETPEQLRKVLASLRSTAKGKMMAQLTGALGAYVSAHDGKMPDEPQDLQPYLTPPLDPAVLARYEIAPSDFSWNLPWSGAKEASTIVLREKDTVDPEYDNHMEFSRTSGMFGPALAFAVRQAQRNYAAANQGQRATEPEQLLPYLKGAIDPAKLRSYLKH
jgi:RNA polymerase sigma factor (sigma-70 family)